MDPVSDRPGSVWAPLGLHAMFRALWLAGVVSNVGTWMQNVAAVWLMASLSPSPLMVALVQTATSLPAFLLALPAGALADVIDRRRLLLVTQGWMLVAAALLGTLTLAGRVTPWLLLGLTFAIGLGSAMTGPAWQAIVPELVPRRDLPAAIALNGVGFNIARAVGPALGGLVLAGAGAGAVFLMNAASFLGVIFALLGWRRVTRPSRLPAEHVIGAIRAGLRYVRYGSALKAVLVRAGAFITCGISLLTLLPLVARDRLGLEASGFGALLASFGIGAIAGAVLLPRLRQRFGPDGLVVGATLAFGIATVALAATRDRVLAGAALVMCGVAWMAVMASFNVAAQVGAATWVQARARDLHARVPGRHGGRQRPLGRGGGTGGYAARARRFGGGARPGRRRAPRLAACGRRGR